MKNVCLIVLLKTTCTCILHTSYTPLLFSSSEMFYGIWYDGGYIERFNDEILTDWQNFLKVKIERKELLFLLFDEKSPAVIDDLLDRKSVV